MYLERVDAILELIARADGLRWQLARLSNRDEANAQSVRNRGSEDKAATFDADDRLLAGMTQYVGFLDKNMDGKVSWREMPKRMKKRLVQGFKAVDTNGDGGLDIDEMVAMRRQGEKQDKPAESTGAD